MVERKLAPIALFVYKRLWHTQRTIEALQKNELAADSDLTIFSDGPKKDADAPAVDAVRRYLRSIDGFKSIAIRERERNRGLAASITAGVTDVVNKHGRVIVLEDDIITSPYFLRFMNDALEKYENIEQVMHVSGYVYPIPHQGLPETYFLRLATCWGWATWQRAWVYYRKDVESAAKWFNRGRMRSFNLDDSYDFHAQIIGNQRGYICTWAIFWYFSIFTREGLSLHPAQSLTQNIGHDNSGTDCSASTVFNVTLRQKKIDFFTDEFALNTDAQQRIVQYFRKIKGRFAFFRRGLRFLLRRFANVCSWIIGKLGKDQ